MRSVIIFLFFLEVSMVVLRSGVRPVRIDRGGVLRSAGRMLFLDSALGPVRDAGTPRRRRLADHRT